MGLGFSGIHHLTLRVRDLDRARWFYGEVLGLEIDQDFPPEPDYPGKLRLRLPDGTRIVLVRPLPGTAADDRFSERRIGLDHVSLSMPGELLEPLVERLRSHGIDTEGARHDELGPRLVSFRDPDNIAWECFEDDQG
ncbi:VOC family protein [Microlunatus parietis]|uniref:Catechol 2,3-dioxygenase-like lactoylglutathione lyase family enzyme n=1 Tax=Microlunatus parietis TaxID=682979 RepID=A0A7Y9I9I9_9ACTN|nr:VOC family protein [Microlunatus parietis]NYE72580.1 catechol 2,3-dioxygenase-like lactoylglutathione lyase family enzyme [Microlunatus parietis]